MFNIHSVSETSSVTQNIYTKYNSDNKIVLCAH